MINEKEAAVIAAIDMMRETLCSSLKNSCDIRKNMDEEDYVTSVDIINKKGDVIISYNYPGPCGLGFLKIGTTGELLYIVEEEEKK